MGNSCGAHFPRCVLPSACISAMVCRPLVGRHVELGEFFVDAELELDVSRPMRPAVGVKRLGISLQDGLVGWVDVNVEQLGLVFFVHRDGVGAVEGGAQWEARRFMS